MLAQPWRNRNELSESCYGNFTLLPIFLSKCCLCCSYHFHINLSCSHFGTLPILFVYIAFWYPFVSFCIFFTLGVDHFFRFRTRWRRCRYVINCLLVCMFCGCAWSKMFLSNKYMIMYDQYIGNWCNYKLLSLRLAVSM